MNTTLRLVATLAVVSLLATGCTPDVEPPHDSDASDSLSDAADNGDDDSGDETEDAGSDEDDSDDASTNGGDVDEGDTSDEPQVTNFTYRRVIQEGCRNSCNKGAWVNFVNGRVGDIQDGTNWELTDAELETLREDFLNQETAQKIKNGWSCGDSEIYMGTRHEFEANIGTGPGSRYGPEVVTGCIPDDSEQDDAQKVQAIADKLIELRNKYESD